MSDYAGLVTRLAALTVDAVLMAIVVPSVANGPPSLWAAMAGEAPGWVKVCSQVLAAFVPLLYFTLCWWGTGQTAGGLVLGTIVRRPDVAHLGPVRAGLRALAGLAFPLVWLVGLVTVLWDPRRRALHDRIFGTVVWYKRAR